MKATLSWLKEYVDINISPDELARKLTMAGISVAGMQNTGNDTLYEFEITSNRNDALSITGIARETAAITGQKLKMPKDLTDGSVIAKLLENKHKGIQISEKELCPVYTLYKISGVKVSESPAWLKERIVSLGMRTVNNIVDVTNFVLMETGQPTHAFDADKLEGDIVVRKAKNGETIITIDGIKRVLSDDMLVIADEKKNVAIAGVMGGLDTEVTSATRNVALESAFFDQISVRRTRRKLGLSTEASYRFERRVDKNMIIPASVRAMNLFRELAGGHKGDFANVGYKEEKLKVLTYSPDKAGEILGISVSEHEQKKILTSLGFLLTEKDKALEVTAPSFRKDVSQSVDLVEEIARIYGYDNIPETIPKAIGNTRLFDKDFILKREIRNILVSAGLDEIVTYNLAGEVALSKFGLDNAKAAKLTNALSQDYCVMVHTLIPGMLRSIAWNINRKNKNIRFFELGKTYSKLGENKFSEELVLSIGMTGNSSTDWMVAPRGLSFFDLKGVVGTLLIKLGASDIIVKKSDGPDYYSTHGLVEINGETAGSIGKIASRTADLFDIKEEVYCAEISVSKLLKYFNTDKKFTPIPKFPSVTRDLSIMSDRSITGEQITSEIKLHGSSLLKKVTLENLYKGKQLPEGKVGLLYRLEFRDDERTLTDEEVESAVNKIRGALFSQLKVGFR